MQVLNLIREFKVQRIKDFEMIQNYSDKHLNIANNVRRLGLDFTEFRIVEKALVTVHER